MASLEDHERRIAALERARPSGPMVSDTFGAGSIRPFQGGFPAELTSDWDATTWYSWKQLLLEGVALAPDTIPLTGDNAVTPDGNKSLTSGTRGWLEPDPTSGGYIFVQDGGAGGSNLS